MKGSNIIFRCSLNLIKEGGALDRKRRSNTEVGVAFQKNIFIQDT